MTTLSRNMIIVCVFAEVTKCWLFQPAHGASCAKGGGDEGKRERERCARAHTQMLLDIITKHYVADVSI